MTKCGHEGLTVFGIDGIPYCTLCEVQTLRRVIAGAQAEIDRLRKLCEPVASDEEQEFYRRFDQGK